MRLLLTIISFGISALAASAHACSVSEDYSWPSNYALVESATAIAIATPVSDDDEAVTFRILSPVKGQPPAVVVMAFAQIGETEPSDPNSILGPHQESAHGGCNRYTFARGGQYVLFLRRTDSDWHVMREPFSRISEDYAGPDSLWMRAINLYLAVQQNPDRMAALDDLTVGLLELEKSGNAADQAIAADIRRHFATAGDEKPTAFLIHWWEAVERGEPLLFPLSGPHQGRVAIDVTQPEYRQSSDRALLSLVNGDHPDAAAFFEHLVSGGPTPRQLGLAIRFFAKNGQYRRAFNLVETDVMRRLGGLADEEAFQLAQDTDRALTGPHRDAEEEREAWRSDPYVLSRWPELALSISSDLTRRRGEGAIGPIRLLQTADPRARPEVTLLLAQDYNEALTAWAVAEVARLTPTADWLQDSDPLWLPVQILAIGFGDQEDAALVRTFCANESGRIMVTTSLGLWGDILDDELLRRFLAMPGLDSDAQDGLRRAILALNSRVSRRTNALGNDEAYEAVVQSLAGNPVTLFDEPVKPVVCPTA